MKIIPKNNNSCYLQYKQEALMLKELRFPGIPLIFDMEEAKDYLYIIEEYIDGETLYERVKNVGTLSNEEIIDFGIKLCEPIIYLHTRKNPILHLDIHPGNIIIRKDLVSLIDFDHSRYKLNNNFSSSYGNIYCSAPEKFENKTVDFRTDIYAIGAVLYYAKLGYFPSERVKSKKLLDKDLDLLISSCLYQDKNMRFNDVKSIKDELSKLALKNKNKSSQNIALVSSIKGLGATYISLGLVSFLKQNNISSVYEEYNDSGDMKVLLENYIRESNEYGSFYVNNVLIKPKIDRENSKLSKNTASVYIKDYGTNLIDAINDKNDLIILICSSSRWKQLENMKSLKIISKIKKYKILYNLCINPDKLLLPEEIEKDKCFKFPYIENIMEDSKKKNDVFSVLLQDVFPLCLKKKKLLNLIR